MSIIYKKQAGFSLLELLVTVAIIAILTTMAIPAYRDYIRSSKRIEGQNILLEVASKQQKYHADNYQYADKMGKLGFGSPDSNAYSTDSGAYEINSQLSGTGFILTAVAKGDQVNDGCINLTLSHTGEKGRSGSSPFSECWH